MASAVRHYRYILMETIRFVGSIVTVYFDSRLSLCKLQTVVRIMLHESDIPVLAVVVL